ncbi:MAG: hypothetical protein IH949_08610, partial [Bacteroidetes bacterium]|nr:hypothetical protein [Bacteroidota bacterium]
MRKNIHIIILSLLFSIVLWVSITMLNDYYTTYNFPLKLVDFPKGYSSGVEIPKDISVKLKGKGWKLYTLNLRARSAYKVSVGKGRGKKVLNLSTFLGENQWLSSDVEVINIQPNTISINVERTRTKKLKIIPINSEEVKFFTAFNKKTKGIKMELESIAVVKKSYGIEYAIPLSAIKKETKAGVHRSSRLLTAPCRDS